MAVSLDPEEWLCTMRFVQDRIGLIMFFIIYCNDSIIEMGDWLQLASSIEPFFT